MCSLCFSIPLCTFAGFIRWAKPDISQGKHLLSRATSDILAVYCAGSPDLSDQHNSGYPVQMMGNIRACVETTREIDQPFKSSRRL